MMRAERRHQQQRMKAKAAKIMAHWALPVLDPSPEMLGKMASTHCRPCSCFICKRGSGVLKKKAALVALHESEAIIDAAR